MISGEAEENNTERPEKLVIVQEALKWMPRNEPCFLKHASSQGGKLLVMLLLDILIASVSAGLWTAWKSSLQTTESHPSPCLSRHWVRWPWQKCLSPCQDGWARLAAFIWEYQEPSSHAGCRKGFLGNREVLSLFHRLKAETKNSLFV